MTNIHKGKSSAIQGQLVMISSRTAAHPIPKYASHRGRIEVRKTMVLVDIMKTPAILMAKMFMEAPTICLIRW